MNVGYKRVSTSIENLENQIDQLKTKKRCKSQSITSKY